MHLHILFSLAGLSFGHYVTKEVLSLLSKTDHSMSKLHIIKIHLHINTVSIDERIEFCFEFEHLG